MSLLDWQIVCGYFSLVLLIGLLVGRGDRKLSDYFLAGRSLGIIPVALSVIATETSAATIIGGPDTAFRGDLAYLQTSIGALLSRFFLAYFFIDVYYRKRVFTVYEYLAGRFSPSVQLFTSLLYAFGRVLASGARLYISAFALSTILGTNLYLTLAAVSAITILYCMVGGLKAVVWTEVFQALIFLAAGAYSIAYVLHAVGGLSAAAGELNSAGKLRIFDFNWNLLSPQFWASPYTFLGAIIGGFTLGTATHGTDQDMVQRLLACRSSSDGRRSLVLAAVLEIPTAVIYVTLGSALWVYYQHSAIVPGPQESVFPHFIRTVVPNGLRGLFVAAILAASMSSFGSVLNALASVSITDLLLPYRSAKKGSPNSDAELIRSSWIHTVGWGITLTMVAGVLGVYHQHLLLAAAGSATDLSHHLDLLTLALGVMSLIYGPLLAIFLIGIFTKKGRPVSLALGVLIGLTSTALIQFGPWLTVGWTWQTVIGCVVTFAIGVIGSDRPRIKGKREE